MDRPAVDHGKGDPAAAAVELGLPCCSLFICFDVINRGRDPSVLKILDRPLAMGTPAGHIELHLCLFPGLLPHHPPACGFFLPGLISRRWVVGPADNTVSIFPGVELGHTLRGRDQLADQGQTKEEQTTLAQIHEHSPEL